MLQEHKSVKEMWESYLISIGDNIADTNKKYISWHFCDNEEDANDLAELVKQGVKRATTSLYDLYEIEGDALPEEGDLDIITDWHGQAQCIIETKKVTIVPFKEVTEAFAHTEGEGDKTLKYWKEVHINAFSRELESFDKKFSEDMLVLCVEFEMVYM
jgi:uncharacterized protein YhfF